MEVCVGLVQEAATRTSGPGVYDGDCVAGMRYRRRESNVSLGALITAHGVYIAIGTSRGAVSPKAIQTPCSFAINNEIEFAKKSRGLP